MADFERSVTVSCPAETVFEFLIRPANLLLIVPSDAVMKIIDAPDRFTLGSKYEFHLGAFGPVQQLIHEITEVEPPTRFTERLVKGPLKSWLHEHIIEQRGDGEVVVTDRIEFEPPGGMVGLLVTEERIRETLEFGFEHRHRELKKILEQNAE